MSSAPNKQYTLLILTVVGVFNFLDRSVMNLAMESIKVDFQLSDSQLGLMTGFAFALFYALAGIPIARWADRGNRNHVVTLVVALWSVMLILFSMVGSFAQLLLVRMGVAVGESGCLPAAHSLIADHFDRGERPKAMAIFWLCGPIATMIAYIGGGWLIDQVGWRNTFILIGLPGLFLAVLVKFTLREPRIEQPVALSTAEEQPSISEVLALLWKKGALRNTLISYTVLSFFVQGVGMWLPTFYIRSHGMGTAELGLWLGISVGGGSFFATYLGGYLATRYAYQREDWQMKGIVASIVLSAVFHVLCCLAEDKTASLIFMTINMGGFIYLTSAPLYAVIQNLVNERVRAVAMALIFMFANLIGMGIGPLAVGFVSDLLEPSLAHDSLRYALLLVSPGYLCAAFYCWKAAVNVRGDIQAVEEKSNSMSDTDCAAKPDHSQSGHRTLV